VRRNKWFSREPTRRATTPETDGSYPANERANERARRSARIREDTDVKLIPVISRVVNCSQARKPNSEVALICNEIVQRQDDSEMSTMKRRTFRYDCPVRERVAIF